jgi:hypothetical protein
MNKILFFIFFTCFSQISLAQESKQIDSLIKVNEESIPVPKETKVYKYVAWNYIVPEVKGLNGNVIVDFVVNEDGSIGDFKIIEDVGYGAAKELIRVLKTLNGKLKATIKDGKPVKTKYSFPLKIESY